MRYFKIEYDTLHPEQGINKEWVLSQALIGTHPKRHNRTKWNEGSDIEPLKMSVKSNRFSLTAGGQLIGDSLTAMVDDYFARVASVQFAYVTCDYEVYVMNADEFKAFLLTFCTVERDSSKNGGRLKVRAPRETSNNNAIIEWLVARARE